MKAHEPQLQDAGYGADLADIKPVIQPGSSDSAALDAVCELMVRNSRHDLPEVKSILIPEAWEQSDTVPQNHRDFYQYANGIMEPWTALQPFVAIVVHGFCRTDRNGCAHYVMLSLVRTC